MIEATILKVKILINLLHFVLLMLLTKNEVIFPVGVNGVIIVIVVFVVVIIILILIFCPYLQKYWMTWTSPWNPGDGTNRLTDNYIVGYYDL